MAVPPVVRFFVGLRSNRFASTPIAWSRLLNWFVPVFYFLKARFGSSNYVLDREAKLLEIISLSYGLALQYMIFKDDVHKYVHIMLQQLNLIMPSH